MACIYQIKNLINNKIYIGSTIRSAYKRKYEHFSGVSPSAIRNNLCNLSNSSGGFIFKYKNILQ